MAASPPITDTTMLFKHLISPAALLRVVVGYAIPSTDGFPNPDDQQVLKIEVEAGGLLSNAPPPPKLSDDGIANFQLIAFNEQFEVAFFSSLVENITNNVAGYQSAPGVQDIGTLLKILNTVKAVSHGLPTHTSIRSTNICTARRIARPQRYGCLEAFQCFTCARAMRIQISYH